MVRVKNHHKKTATEVAVFSSKDIKPLVEYRQPTSPG